MADFDFSSFTGPFTAPSSSSNMVANYFTTPSTSGFNLPSTSFSPQNLFSSGSPLGKSYTPSMFAPSQDYSSIFNQAARGIYGGPSISGTPGEGGSGSSARRSTGPRLGSGGSAVMPGEAPLDYYLGPTPTLTELNLNYEEMGKRAMEANKPYAEQYRQFAPQTEAGARALSQAGATMATGQLSRDMVGQIGRGAAALGFSSGLGGRSGIGRNILARDLGLGSLQVQQQGADLLSKSSMLAQQAMQAMSPISPNEVFGTAANQASINQQIANQNLLNAYQSQALPGQFDIRKGQYVGYQPGTYSDAPPMTPAARAQALAAKKAGGGQYNQFYTGPRV